MAEVSFSSKYSLLPSLSPSGAGMHVSSTGSLAS